jgi:6-phosphogluconate dehydrogenase (decarboxylating)
MQLGMIGLGRMGANIVRRLMRDGHECVVWDVSADAIAALEKEGATGAATLEEFTAKLTKPRVAWVMIPAGLTGATVEKLGGMFEDGDMIIDGGNSNYRDDIHRADALRPKGIHYIDIGTSGGVFGLERGYCLMIGGHRCGRAHRAATEDDRARCRGCAPHARNVGPAEPGRAGLPALRSERRRSLRQDGSQRYRIRDHGLLRRGPERAAPSEHRQRVRRSVS